MIVVFGSINLDLIVSVPHLPIAGETVIGPSVRFEPGGKGANQAVAAARDGANVFMAGAVGQDVLADRALALLQESGIDLTRIKRTDIVTGCAAIAVDVAGNNAISVGSGANLLARQDQVEDSILSPSVTLVLQMELPADQIEALIRRARPKVGRIILNLAPAVAVADDALRSLDLLVVNETEGAWLARQYHCANTTKALHAAVGIGVIRTLGGEGVEAATIDGEWRLPADPITPVDTTAAGDCFVGVLAASLDRHLGLEAALRRASAAAALCCLHLGSQGSIPRKTETDRFLEARAAG